MIKILTGKIGPDGLDLEGEEPFSFLEIEKNAYVRPCGPVSYSLHAAMARHDLVVTGSTSFPAQSECARCLEPIEVELKTSGICHCYEEVEDKDLDITADIREDILLSIPQSLLCSEDCRGLCPNCGAHLNKGSCKCKIRTEKGPSPWDELDELQL